MWIFKGKVVNSKNKNKKQKFSFLFSFFYFFLKNRGSTVRRIVIDMHAVMIWICRVFI